MSRLDALRKSLADFLAREWDTPVEIDDLRPVSAGARRLNVLFDAKRSARSGDGEVVPLVATIIPTQAIQVMPISIEASTLRLAEEAGMPVPHVHALCDDAAVLGGAFFVTGRVEGETIPRQVLRVVESKPGLGHELGRQCGAALAALHAVDVAKAHADLVRPAPGGASPAARGLEAAKQLLESLLQPSPAFSLAYRWLERNAPRAPERLSVVHGDFRNGNMIVGDDGLRAALDWEVSHIGDPMEDLGWLCQRMWRFRNDTLEVGGFADRSDLRAGYEAAGGTWDEASFHWWKTFGTFRWGLGLAGQAAAHLDGSFRSIVMAGSGRRVAELEYDTLMLLRRGFE